VCVCVCGTEMYVVVVVVVVVVVCVCVCVCESAPGVSENCHRISMFYVGVDSSCCEDTGDGHTTEHDLIDKGINTFVCT
jgi:hypothetical protein